jgi:hypothetical protein
MPTVPVRTGPSVRSRPFSGSFAGPGPSGLGAAADALGRLGEVGYELAARARDEADRDLTNSLDTDAGEAANQAVREFQKLAGSEAIDVAPHLEAIQKRFSELEARVVSDRQRSMLAPRLRDRFERARGAILDHSNTQIGVHRRREYERALDLVREEAASNDPTVAMRALARALDAPPDETGTRAPGPIRTYFEHLGLSPEQTAHQIQSIQRGLHLANIERLVKEARPEEAERYLALVREELGPAGAEAERLVGPAAREARADRIVLDAADRHRNPLTGIVDWGKVRAEVGPEKVEAKAERDALERAIDAAQTNAEQARLSRAAPLVATLQQAVNEAERAGRDGWAAIKRRPEFQELNLVAPELAARFIDAGAARAAQRSQNRLLREQAKTEQANRDLAIWLAYLGGENTRARDRAAFPDAGLIGASPEVAEQIARDRARAREDVAKGLDVAEDELISQGKARGVGLVPATVTLRKPDGSTAKVARKDGKGGLKETDAIPGEELFVAELRLALGNHRATNNGALPDRERARAIIDDLLRPVPDRDGKMVPGFVLKAEARLAWPEAPNPGMAYLPAGGQAAPTGSSTPSAPAPEAPAAPQPERRRTPDGRILEKLPDGTIRVVSQ